MQRQYVRALNLHYRLSDDGTELIFDDGVRYTVQEAMILAKGRAKEEDVRKIHLVKRFFNGILEEFPFGLDKIMPQPDPPVQKASPVQAVPELARKSRKGKGGSPGVPDSVQLRMWEEENNG